MAQLTIILCDYDELYLHLKGGGHGKCILNLLCKYFAWVV